MEKIARLKEILREMESALVAFSGGVDSTLLLKIAHDVLGERALAVTAVSPTLPPHELAEAKALAHSIGVRHVIFQKHDMQDPRFVANSPDKCYFCKAGVCDQLTAYAQQHGYRFVLDGANADDTGDYRPGTRASREYGVRSPLQEVGLRKDEVRDLARELGLSNWDKPASACLASRIPYGTPITEQRLKQIEQAELALQALGLRQCRVRHHAAVAERGAVARIEVPVVDFERVLAHRAHIVSQFQAVGYYYVTLDLQGFRSGSMNEVLISDG